MLKLKKIDAFKLACDKFGPWESWGRSEHLAYGIMRGIPYSSMEKYANDNPHACNGVAMNLWKLEIFKEEYPLENMKWEFCRKVEKEIAVWVRKPIRVKVLESAAQ